LTLPKIRILNLMLEHWNVQGWQWSGMALRRWCSKKHRRIS
jgi:hypothetical protein